MLRSKPNGRGPAPWAGGIRPRFVHGTSSTPGNGRFNVAVAAMFSGSCQTRRRRGSVRRRSTAGNGFFPHGKGSTTSRSSAPATQTPTFLGASRPTSVRDLRELAVTRRRPAATSAHQDGQAVRSLASRRRSRGRRQRWPPSTPATPANTRARCGLRPRGWLPPGSP